MGPLLGAANKVLPSAEEAMETQILLGALVKGAQLLPESMET